MKSYEEAVNQIRNRLIEVNNELLWLKSQGSAYWPRIQRAADKVEDIAVDFERFVNSLPVEARS